MEIYLERRAVRQIRAAAREAIEEDDTEPLREEILDVLPEDRVPALEKLVDEGDLFAFVSSMLEDWGGEDIDELFEVLETGFGEIDVDLSTDYNRDVNDAEVLEVEDEFPEMDLDDDDDDVEGEEAEL